MRNKPFHQPVMILLTLVERHLSFYINGKRSFQSTIFLFNSSIPLFSIFFVEFWMIHRNLDYSLRFQLNLTFSFVFDRKFGEIKFINKFNIEDGSINVTVFGITKKKEKNLLNNKWRNIKKIYLITGFLIHIYFMLLRIFKKENQ